MTRKMKWRGTLAAALLSGGMLYQNGCLNALYSIQICGVVLPATVCTPEDQLLLVFPFLEVPDFEIDPTCTIPFGCFDRGDDVNDGEYPFGGGPPNPPTQNSGGGGI